MLMAKDILQVAEDVIRKEYYQPPEYLSALNYPTRESYPTERMREGEILTELTGVSFFFKK